MDGVGGPLLPGVEAPDDDRRTTKLLSEHVLGREGGLLHGVGVSDLVKLDDAATLADERHELALTPTPHMVGVLLHRPVVGGVRGGDEDAL